MASFIFILNISYCCTVSSSYHTLLIFDIFTTLTFFIKCIHPDPTRKIDRLHFFETIAEKVSCINFLFYRQCKYNEIAAELNISGDIHDAPTITVVPVLSRCHAVTRHAANCIVLRARLPVTLDAAEARRLNLFVICIF